MNKTEALPRVRMQTSEGDLLIELYSEQSPKTVANFLQYVESGHYEGTVFHRVIEGFMIQGGGYDESFKERPAREPVENESRNGVSNSRGTLSMARTPSPHSARCQFFINHRDNASLDAEQSPGGWGYAVFGKVIEGMDVVDHIATAPTGSKGPFPRDAPQTTVSIQSIVPVDGTDAGQ